MAANQVAFNQIPGDVRVPMFLAELNSGPPSYSGNSRQIVIGRALTGSVAASSGKPVTVGSSDPNTIAGPGSIGAEQLLYARRRNPIGELWFVSAADPANAVAATGTVTIAGTATGPGTLTRYVGGERYDVNVATGDTATVVAAALAARIGQGYAKFGRRMLPAVAAASALGVVTLTGRHGGTECNGISILAGLDGDEVEVPGLTVTIAAMSGGAGDVDMADALSRLGSQAFDFIGGPYSTTAQLNAARDFLNNRWSPLVGLQCHYCTGYEGNLSGLTAFGLTRNDPHVTVLGLNKLPHPRWSIVAALDGEIAFLKNLGRSLKTAIEIARPMQTRVLEGLRPPADPNDRFAAADRDSLLRNGISTTVVTEDGQIACDRIITTYRVNAAGLPDTNLLDIEKLMIGIYVTRYMKQKLVGTYPRHVMMEDNPGLIQGVVTPPQARGTVIHAYEDLHQAGLVRQVDLFVANLIVDFDYESDRANFYLPTAAAAALRVFAANVTLFNNLDDQNASGL
ncbi:phage tail sheath subtilisin-like domain-containing protein [uncultured Methylobacterium sp.]|uniref:phage tail sheath subtilisin-like domain-containing protein n=1 Tax=uncultured Methylobacterium sp. TaxID=157278 RepID=UPI0035CAA6CA